MTSKAIVLAVRSALVRIGYEWRVRHPRRVVQALREREAR